jgi:hypothetical protein
MSLLRRWNCCLAWTEEVTKLQQPVGELDVEQIEAELERVQRPEVQA